MSREPGQAAHVIQYWNTERRPGYIDDLMTSFSERNPDLQHLVFDESESAAFIARHFSAREADAFAACAVPAMQADYFRYCAVLALGGVYADADVECLRPLGPLVESTPVARLFRRPSGVVVNAFFLFRAAGHPLLRLTLDVATANVECRASGGGVWLTTGPGIFTSLHMLAEAGSADAFIARAGDRPPTDAEAFLRSARLICEVVGSQRRVERAFEGVTVSSVRSGLSWVGVERAPLPYKQTDSDWRNVGGSIYR